MRSFVMAGVLVVALSGCGAGPGGTTVVGPDGTKVTTSADGSVSKVETTDGGVATYSQDGKSMKFETSDGKKFTASEDGNIARFEDGEGNSFESGANVDHSKLWVPVYPGAKVSAQGGTRGSSAEETVDMVSHTSPDSIAAIESFYKSKLDGLKRSAMDFEGEQAVMLQYEQGKRKALVTLRRKSGDKETTIEIIATESKK